MVTYQFEVDDETWDEWKGTIPRSKAIHTRLVELIEADLDGRVWEEAERPSPARSTAPVHEQEPSNAPSEESESGPSARSESEAGSEEERHDEAQPTESRESVADPPEAESVDRAALIEEMPGRGEKPAARADAVLAMRDRLRERGSADWQDLLDIVDPDIVGYQDRNSFWKNCGRMGLKKFDNVERPPRDSDEWTWVG